MEKALGVGGIFFRSKDPKALADWYRKYLGINPVPEDAGAQPWVTDGGVTVFAPFPEDTDYFEADQRHMINFRVADLGRMMAQLAQAGIKVGARQTLDGIGHFARIHDPEGNPIELWQPA